MHLSEGILPLKQIILSSSLAIPFVVGSYRVFKVKGCPGKLNFLPPKDFKAEVHDVMFRGLCKACIR